MRKNKYQKNNDDLGFGGQMSQNSVFFKQDGKFNIKRIYGKYRDFNLYHWFVSISWFKFISIIVLFYLVINIIFAYAFWLVGLNNLAGGISEKSFSDAFFFSIQTTTTVGYGSLYPNSLATNIISALASFSGLLTFAVITGLLYSRFSRPKARLLFSNICLLTPYQDITALVFRIAPRSSDVLSDLQAQVILTYIKPENGMRIYQNLSLERDTATMLPLNWNIVHPITDESPVFNWTKEEFVKNNAEIMVTIKGLDEASGQMVRIVHSYKSYDFVLNKKFALMFEPSNNGETVFDLRKIDLVQ